MRQKASLIVTAIILILYVLPCSAGKILKCKDAKGNVTFSSSACPEATVDKELKGTYKAQPARKPDDYYSPTNQMRRINKRKAIARERRAEKRRQGAISQSQNMPSQITGAQQLPVMSYKEAKRRALKDAGYRNYNNLSASQRGRVNKEMAKYNHLPPEPRPKKAQKPRESNEERERRERDERIRKVEHRYEREKRVQEIGISARKYEYKEAIRDCKRTIGANCD